MDMAQFSEQDPGPLASPHAPQGEGIAAREGSRLLTAKTESCLSRCWPWQEGQCGVAVPCTSCSKWWAQSRQTYSKMGMGELYLWPAGMGRLA